MAEAGPSASTSRQGSTWGERRFGLLLGFSLLLHLFLTPLVGLLGLAGQWLDHEAEPPPFEELDAIPLDLIEDSESMREQPTAGELPEADPVDVIDKLIAAPAVSTPPASASSSAAPPASTPAAPSAPPSATAAPSAAPTPSSPPPPPEPQADAGVAEPKPTSKPKRSPDAGVATKPRARKIDNPLSLAGETAEIVKSNAKLQLIVYTDRLREHPVGIRAAALLPRLPQWNDFFPRGSVNPVLDFDRFFVAGPSFYHSDQLVVALEYNTRKSLMLDAIDRLVQRDGKWLDKGEVPTALAVADRAERLFVVGERTIWVVPPKLKRDALRLQGRRIPHGDGQTALVATIADPKKSFWRLGLEIPETVRDLKLRITPMPEGAVKLEISAKDKNAESAERTAAQVGRGINSMVDMVTGVSSMLNRLGFGGLVRGMQLPRVELRARGDEIWAEQTLSRAQAEFILDRVERQLIAQTNPEPAKTAPSARPSQGAPRRAAP